MFWHTFKTVSGLYYLQVMGIHGATMINEVLEERGVQLEYILDEGLTIVEGVYPGISKPVAT